ncbi:MAG: choice-of-anchor D domain-containing protein [Proteobacteria bacterium]|nr:choice-of-anchor D domain-containing protein [Pseudomonadota bacterium]
MGHRKCITFFFAALLMAAQPLLAGCGDGDLVLGDGGTVDGGRSTRDGGGAKADGGAARGDASSGDGRAGPVALLELAGAPAIAFTAVVGGAADEQTITIDNGGGAAATALVGTVGAPFVFKGGSYPGAGGTCGAMLGAATNCTVVIAFAPAAPGEVLGTLAFDYWDGQRQQRAQRSLVGGGRRPAVLAISDGPTFSFGAGVIGTTTEQIFTVNNAGGSEARALAAGALAAPFAFKGGSFPGGGSCGATLAAGASCTLVVVYTPADAAAHGGTVSLAYDNGALGQQAVQPTTVGLAGAGITPAALSISEGEPYDFGPQPIGVSVDKTLTVHNGGAAAAASLSSAALGNGFDYKGGVYPGTGGAARRRWTGWPRARS